MSPDDAIFRCKSPVPSVVISKRTVGVAIGVLALAIGVSLALKRPEAPKEATKTQSGAVPQADFISSLPKNYGQLPREEKKGPAVLQLFKLPGASGPSQAELDRLARIKEARKSPLVFQGVSVPPVNARMDAPMSSYQPGNNGTTSQPGQTSARDDANRQDDKNNFLNQKRDHPEVLPERIKEPLSDYQLMAGTMIPGVLLTGINSDLPGQILGQVSQNVYDTVDGRYLLVPQGTKIIGEYDSRVVYGQERVLVVWTRLIFPNGNSFSLESMPGVDLSGYAGVSDQVNNHYLRLLTGVVLSSTLSVGAQIAAGRNYNSFNPNYGELAAQGFSQNINNVGQQIVNRDLRVQPTIEIRPGSRINIFVNKDMVLEPFED